MFRMEVPFVVLLLLAAISHNVRGSRIINTFHPDPETELRNIVRDEITGSIYVGTVNYIYKLNGDNLGQENFVTTGPKPDNVLCPPDPSESCCKDANSGSCTIKRKPTDCTNNALVHDKTNDVLIACSNLYYGSCEKINLATFESKGYEYKPIVSNDPDRPPFVFIAEGLDAVGNLYVASPKSRVGDTAIRNTVPILATRKLSNFAYARTGTFKDILPDSQFQYFDLVYKYAFEYKGYNYYLSVQRESVTSKIQVTKIIRICQLDEQMRSYIELPLVCDKGNVNYNVLSSAVVVKPGKILADALALRVTDDFLFGAFSKEDRSMICGYPMKIIERAFQQTLESCFTGQSSARIGPRHLALPKRCTQSTVDVSDNYCGEFNANNPIEGLSEFKPYTRTAVNGDILTAIRIKIVNEHTIIYAGSQTGKLYKIVQEHQQADIYDVMPLESGPILPRGLEFDTSKEHLYAMTDTKVLKVLVSACEEYNTCETCLGSGDPHCGWCFFKNICSVQSECTDTGVFQWKPHNSQCPSVTSTVPSKVPHASFDKKSISLVMNEFPSAEDSDVWCVLQGIEPSQRVGAQVNSWGSRGHEVLCNTFKPIVEIPPGQDYMNITVMIQVQTSEWASTQIRVFDCARLDNCTSCASSEMPCQWCVQQHTCVPQDNACSGKVVAAGAAPTGSTPAYNVMYGKESCPIFDLLPSTSQLLAPSDVARSFTVRGYNLQDFHDDLECRFSLPSQTVVAKASVRGGTVSNVKDITCEQRVLSYNTDSPFVMVPFDIIWKKTNKLDNPSHLQVKVYRCSKLASTCGACLLLDASYSCGWCETGCTLSRDCHTGWLDRDKHCTKPQIQSFSPRGGPVRGGTLLTINGVNLGKTVADIQEGVRLGDVQCSVIPAQYLPPQTIVCKTQPSSAAQEVDISVTVAKQYNTSSRTKYVYRNPEASGYSPLSGPMSGGTRITVKGANLDLGSNMTIVMNNKLCPIERRSATELEFLTPKETQAYNIPIKLYVDQSQGDILMPNFKYQEDPVVDSVEPKSAVISGGNKITVKGRNLNIVQSAKMEVIVYGDVTRSANCTADISTVMLCSSPDLSEFALKPSPDLRRRRRAMRRRRQVDWELVPKFPVNLPFSLLLDGMRWPAGEGSIQHRLTYYKDPYFYTFSGKDRMKDYSKDMDLEISGEELHVFNFFKNDAKVLVGGSLCPVESVDKVRVICKPPANPHNMTNGQATVVAILGNIRSEVGYLRYGVGGTSTGAIVGAVIGVFLTIVIIVVIVLFCLRRRKLQRKGRNKIVLPPPNAVPNTYLENKDSADHGADGAAGEAIPLKSAEGKENLEKGTTEEEDPVGEKSHWNDLLNRIENTKIRQAVAEVIISKDRLEVGELVGKGHFSCVYAGTLLDENYENPEKVAVKTLQGNEFDRASVENFLKEGVIMKNFNHPHVIRLLGVVVSSGTEPMVVLPFMANGDLRSYVKDKKKNFTARQLLSLAQQVAEGMAYLSSLNCVHRDLAARNCMIDEQNVVKVADFGLTRDLYERDYYSSKDRKAKLPIKWMALESLEDFVFTNRTDIWSFGVLMWELMTRGVTPYPDVDVFDIRQYLASGRRLRKPKYCPDNVYKIMLDCWAEIPESRPSFADLVNRLEMLLNPPKKKQAPKPSEPAEGEPMYMNITKTDSTEYLNPVTPPAEA